MGTISGPVGGLIVGGFVAAYFAARTLSRYNALSRTDWQGQADALVSNYQDFNVDQKELKEVLNYYTKNYRDMIDYHCPYAQDRLFRIMSARFTNLKTIRFEKGFDMHGGVMLNPDNIVQLRPTNGKANIPIILLYSGTDGAAPLRIGNPENINSWPNTQSTPLWWPTTTWWPAGLFGE